MTYKELKRQKLILAALHEKRGSCKPGSYQHYKVLQENETMETEYHRKKEEKINS